MSHLILLHGALGSGVQMAALETILAEHYTIHRPDFPGHGGSAMPETFSIELFAENIRDYCAARQISSCSIFGYSMGGYVALYLANKSPELVNKLITLGTKFNWDEATAAKEAGKLQPEVMEVRIPSLVQLLHEHHAPNSWKEVVQKTAHLLTGLGKENLLSTEVFKKIQAPVLLMHGDQDRMVSIEETVNVFRQLPDARLCVLPDTAHAIEAVDWSMAAPLVLRFLKA
jgi:pimeloyl-ACP methyl ester carboxylesterase